MLTRVAIVFWMTAIHIFSINAMALSNQLQQIKNLELAWNIRENIEHCEITDHDSCGSICKTCEGDGKLRCRFCGGTGFLMLDGVLIGTANKCPVCNGIGFEECKECMGAGHIAHWLRK